MGKLDSEEEKQTKEEAAKPKQGLVERIQNVLKDDVSEVRARTA